MVPGRTGDSRMTVVCGRMWAARVRAAASTWVRSGPPSAPGGVGAQMTAVRTRPSSAGPAGPVGVRKPVASIRRTSAGVSGSASGPVR